MGYRIQAAWHGALAIGLTMALPLAAPQAQAAGMKECSLKYQAAKQAGTLNGQDWKAFRAAQCGSASAAGTQSAAATPAAQPATAAPASAPAAAAPAAPATRPATATAPATTAATAAAAPTGNATFPTAVNSKYASLKPGKARMQTCLDQYHANKTSGGNGGLKWIQKGGGYFSTCTKRLKAA